MGIKLVQLRIGSAHTVRRGLSMLVTTGVVAAGLIAGVGTSSAQASASDASYFVNAINAQRAAHGRARLSVSSAMTAAAQSWAEQMARSNTLYHNPHLSSSVSNWKYLGENVGVGPSDSSLEAAFWASTPHRANMLDSDYTEIGVAVVNVKGKLWVAEEFRRPMTSSSSSPHHKTVHHKHGVKQAVSKSAGKNRSKSSRTPKRAQGQPRGRQ